MSKFSERLKELRAEKSLSTRELAQKTGLSYSAISHWERGIREPSAYALIKLAEFFDVTVDYLLGREN